MLKIKIARGIKEFIPELKNGELGFAKDTNELFIGNLYETIEKDWTQFNNNSLVLPPNEKIKSFELIKSDVYEKITPNSTTLYLIEEV